MDPESLESLTTEGVLPESHQLDSMSSLQFVELMNAQDSVVVDSVAQCAQRIAAALDAIVPGMQAGGRLIYGGAGTSGRLGVLDAAECPPTFRASPDQVRGLIAGGPAAFLQAVEGAEDSAEAGANAIRDLDLTKQDTFVGIAASGRTPWVLGALAAARASGALTVALSCNANSPISAEATHALEVVVGPEILTGSTRLKAGTATKMVLNMLSTGTFVRLGKTYRNLMVDLSASNEKLRARSVRIVALATELNHADAAVALESSDGDVKTAIVAQRGGVEPDRAREALGTVDGFVQRALDALQSASRKST